MRPGATPGGTGLASSRAVARRAPWILITLLLAGLVPPGHVSSGEPVRTFDVEASKYEFRPSRLEVTQGETVRITIRSSDTKHGFGIEAFDIEQEVPRRGRPVTVEFVAETAGEFRIKCTEYCGRGHRRMRGVLVVRPRSGTE